MSGLLQRLSAPLFFLFGLSFLVSYVLFIREIGESYAVLWLTVMDLPFALTACVYGASSLYRSVTPEEGSKGAAWAIGVVVACVFIVLCLMNFWPLFN